MLLFDKGLGSVESAVPTGRRDNQRAERHALNFVDVAVQQIDLEAEALCGFGQRGAIDALTLESQPPDPAFTARQQARGAVTYTGRDLGADHFLQQGARNRLLGRGEDVSHRAQLGEPAVIQYRDAMRNGLDDLHLVGDQHDGQAQAAVDIGEQREDRLRGLGVERRGRLIAQQHARLGGQRPGDADTLFLAAADLARVTVTLFAQTDEFKQFIDTLGNPRLWHAGELEGQSNVAGHGT